MSKQSAGILLFRRKGRQPEFLLVHPGGPFFAKKDTGAWSIPKGEFADDELPLAAAKREFKEELGVDASGKFIALTPIKQKGGKLVYAWALEGDINPDDIKSNTFEVEWPPKSGQKKEFPEIDKGAWFNTATAKQKINPAQAILIDELMSKMNYIE